jgi:hypothetical protein
MDGKLRSVIGAIPLTEPIVLAYSKLIVLAVLFGTYCDKLYRCVAIRGILKKLLPKGDVRADNFFSALACRLNRTADCLTGRTFLGALAASAYCGSLDLTSVLVLER